MENEHRKDELAELQEKLVNAVSAPSIDEAAIARLTQKAASADALRSENTQLAIELNAVGAELAGVKRQAFANEQKVAQLEEVIEHYSAALTKYKKIRMREIGAQPRQLQAENGQVRMQLEPTAGNSDDWKEPVQVATVVKSPRKPSAMDLVIEGAEQMKDQERHRFLRSVGRVWLSQHCGFLLSGRTRMAEALVLHGSRISRVFQSRMQVPPDAKRRY